MKRIMTLALLVLLLAAAPLLAVKRPVAFRYQPMIGGVGKVFLAGSFNSWSPNNPQYQMKESGGIYTITILLEPGSYQYKFVIDGSNWITDPNAKETAPDGFGGKNGVITVSATDSTIILKTGDGLIFDAAVDHKVKLPYVSPKNDEKTAIDLKLQVAAKDVAEITLYLSRNGGAFTAMQTRKDTELSQGDTDFFFATVTGLNAASKLQYYFRLKDGNKTIWFCDSGAVNGEAAAKAKPFQYDDKSITIFKTPDWVKNGVMYQIFPERFFNGKPENDPTFTEKDLYWTTSPNPKPEVLNPDNPEYYYHVKQWNRFSYLGNQMNGQRYFSTYGGDIIGVEKKLGYLKDLGVSIIYFNPVFRAKSNHKYDAVDFTQPDPTFASKDEFKRFVQKAHAMGIRIIIDSSFNHTGDKHYAFRDTRLNGPKSKYWTWYEWKKWPIPDVVNKISDYYNCWWGFGSLPDLNFDLKAEGANENPKANIYMKKGDKYYLAVDIQKIHDQWGIIWDKNPSVPTGAWILTDDVNWEVVNHIFNVAWFWTRDMGVDGWRLDVANECPFWFWKFFRKVVKQANPQAYLVGEIWSAANIWLGGDYFDAVMNYKYFKEPVMKFIGEGQGSAAQFDAELKPARVDYPQEAQYAQMNLLGSHDTHRYLTAIKNNYPRLLLTYVFGMTYIGAPQIYYGDEVGEEGGKDPDCRRTFYWDYEKVPHKVAIRNWIKKLAHIRHKYSALRTGKYKTVLTEGKIMGYTRWDNKNTLVVLINSGDEGKASLDAAACGLKDGDKLRDLVFGGSYTVSGGKLDVALAKVTGRILVKE